MKKIFFAFFVFLCFVVGCNHDNNGLTDDDKNNPAGTQYTGGDITNCEITETTVAQRTSAFEKLGVMFNFDGTSDSVVWKGEDKNLTVVSEVNSFEKEINNMDEFKEVPEDVRQPSPWEYRFKGDMIRLEHTEYSRSDKKIAWRKYSNGKHYVHEDGGTWNEAETFTGASGDMLSMIELLSAPVSAKMKWKDEDNQYYFYSNIDDWRNQLKPELKQLYQTKDEAKNANGEYLKFEVGFVGEYVKYVNVYLNMFMGDDYGVDASVCVMSFNQYGTTEFPDTPPAFEGTGS